MTEDGRRGGIIVTEGGGGVLKQSYKLYLLHPKRTPEGWFVFYFEIFKCLF